MDAALCAMRQKRYGKAVLTAEKDSDRSRWRVLSFLLHMV
jgi:hypothetical protein